MDLIEVRTIQALVSAEFKLTKLDGDKTSESLTEIHLDEALAWIPAAVL